MSGLSRYAVEARGVADEIIHHIKDYDGLFEHCRRLVARNGLARIVEMNHEQLEAARAFLKKTPSQREAIHRKLASPKEEVKNEAILTMLRARYLGLMGANALDMADDLALIPGCSYREATLRAANRAFRSQIVPDEAEMFRTRY